MTTETPNVFPTVDEQLDLLQKGIGHDTHQRGRSNRLLAMEPKEAANFLLSLQPWNVDFQMHAVNPFRLLEERDRPRRCEHIFDVRQQLDYCSSLFHIGLQNRSVL